MTNYLICERMEAMLQCSNCDHKQDSGKFCEACGQPVVPQQTNEPENSTIQQKNSGHASQTAKEDTGLYTSPDNKNDNNDTAEAMKTTLHNYWHFFIYLLKNPAHSFSLKENHFVNGLITIGLFVVLLPLGGYFFLNIAGEVPFSMVFALIFVLLIILAIVFFSAFAMIKVSKHPDSIKLLLTQFAGLLTPAVLLNGIVLFGGIVKSGTLLLIPAILALVYTISYVPVFLVYEKSSEVQPQGSKIYVSFLTVIIISILFYILGETIATNMLNNVLDQLFWYGPPF